MALHRELSSASSGSRNMILTGASMSATVPTASACAQLLGGPPLFAAHNLLAAADALPAQDHAQLKLTIGARGSFDAHLNFYGVDSYSHLVEGEKMWFLAPPEQRDAFVTLFERHAPLGSDLSTDARAVAFCAGGVMGMHQRAGELLYLPGGWVYAVQNLTQTVSFGASYLRAWNLALTLDYAQQRGAAQADEAINLEGVFAAAARGYWGVSPEEAQRAQARWATLQDQWHDDDEHHDDEDEDDDDD